MSGPCPAGGEHTWAEQDTGDAIGIIGGAAGTHTVRGWACDECGAPMPAHDEEPYEDEQHGGAW